MLTWNRNRRKISTSCLFFPDRQNKLKAAKSAGPDQIPPRMINEHAYEELSVPLTDILNSSFFGGHGFG